MRYAMLLTATLLTVPLLLAVRGAPAPAPAVSQCNMGVLAAKMQRFADSSALVTERASELMARFATFARRWGETTEALRRRESSQNSDGAFMAELCRAYDELQTIVDEAAAKGPSPDGADRTPRAETRRDGAG